MENQLYTTFIDALALGLAIIAMLMVLSLFSYKKESKKNPLQALISSFFKALKGFALFAVKTAYRALEWVVKSILGNKEKCEGAEWLEGFFKKRKFTSKKQQGFILDGHGKQRLSLKQSYKNILCVAASGRGKSSRVIAPNILGLSENKKIKPCQIIIDVSGELWKQTSSYLEKQGYACMRLNFTNPLDSIGYNPFDYIHSTSDLKEMVDTLMVEFEKTEPYWSGGAKKLATILLHIQFTHESLDKSLPTLIQLTDLFASDPEVIDDLVSECDDRELYDKYKALIASEEKSLQGFISTFQNAIEKLENESCKHILTLDKRVRFEDFREKPCALFITLEEARFPIYAPVLNLLFTQMLYYFTQNDKGLPVFFLLDEAGQLTINNFEVYSTITRKRSIALVLMLQSTSQLTERYGTYNAKTILKGGFSNQYVISPEHEHAKDISDQLGMVTCNEKRKPLLSVEELKNMGEDEAVLLSDTKPLFIKNCKPYYKVRRWKAL